MPDYIKESLLELARVVLLSILPILMASVSPETGVINIDPQVVLAVGLLAFLRWVDKTVHLYGKAKHNDTAKLGITRF